MVGALGVVFGDIGTSPLYSLQTVFSLDDHAVRADSADVYGVVSLVFWAITLVVSVKYVTLVMRADNDGEGGVLALAHLARNTVQPGRSLGFLMVLGVLGAALFFGDSVITPAITVLSAVEGIGVADPAFDRYTLPFAVVIIAGLFLLQSRGTEKVGRLFGPVMALWFIVLGVLGLPRVIAHPQVLLALLPTYAGSFIVSRPLVAFVAMGAVVLAITGAEALYADMGHFGRPPIRRAWFFLVLPCLLLNYLGQAQLILSDPSAVENPFFHLAPGWATIPLVVLATAATIIASQSVISGAYSVARQAERLGYLPRLTVRQTSTRAKGQIYVPAVNWALCLAVLAVVVAFQQSSRLATAYGLAVTCTFLLTTLLFGVYAHAAWHWPVWRTLLTIGPFAVLELLFFAANTTKLAHGGLLPVLIAAVLALAMLTWRRGAAAVTERRAALEGPLPSVIERLHEQTPSRVPGTAIFLHPDRQTAPLALRENAFFNHAIHERVLIVSIASLNVPHVPPSERVGELDDLGDPDDHIDHLTLKFGFSDHQHIPRALEQARRDGVINLDPAEVSYFVSRMTLQEGEGSSVMARWRVRLFITMAHNAADPTEYFGLPNGQVVIMGTQLEI